MHAETKESTGGIRSRGFYNDSGAPTKKGIGVGKKCYPSMVDERLRDRKGKTNC
jgi:hypothetical protein